MLKFFLNSNNQDYLRNLETELGDNTNAIRVELNKMEDAGLLKSFSRGNKKIFQSNTDHPLFSDINSILMKITGIDQLLKRVISQIGDLQFVYLTGALAKGNESEIMDLILVGNINREYLNNLIFKTEKFVKKKIRYLVFDPNEFETKKEKILSSSDLLLWKK
ncbi:MAG: ArsR family transcriptional regulator [Bacteroidia bacterium]|nr:ArsR family transcriptional regulator [Bacteroidia bacterium]